MLVVETIAKIRRYHFVEERPLKQISRDLNISRNTVRKVIRSQVTEHRYEREDQQYPRLKSFSPLRRAFSGSPFSLQKRPPLLKAKSEDE